MNFKIIGTGSRVPKLSVDNNKLSEFLDTSDEWIVSRTGIRERRVCTDETLTELSVGAAQRAVENAGIRVEDLDLILCSTIAGDFFTPSLACVVQRALGASCPAVDLNAACSGFIYALDIADSYFSSGKVKNVLIVSAEEMSKMVDWKDRATCVLFGDGAAAVVLTQGESLLSIKLSARGGTEVLRIPTIQGNSPFRPKNREVRTSSLYMNGQEVYKFAVSSAGNDIAEVIQRAKVKIENIAYFILHQANYRIVETIMKKLKQPREKFPMVIQKYGNTSSSCVPIMLDEMNRGGKLKRGDLLVISAFGGGLTTGACVLRW